MILKSQGEGGYHPSNPKISQMRTAIANLSPKIRTLKVHEFRTRSVIYPIFAERAIMKKWRVLS